MATIAFFQNRLGRTDGVSLEIDKWRRILEDKMGHRVIYCSGNNDVPGNYVLPELYALHPTTSKILRNSTVSLSDYTCEEELEYDIYALADVIEEKLLALIEEEKVDVLIPNNLCSGGYQPAAAIALHRVIRKTQLPTIIHSHDFYYEDSGEVNATCHTVASIYDRYFPAKLPNVQHVFINKIAQSELKRRKNIDGSVVPNVFDFNQDQWLKDSYNSDFRAAFDIRDDDLVFLQATRILDRKGIELAIDTLAGLQQASRRERLNGVNTVQGRVFTEDSRIIYLCAGIVEDIGISAGYWENLKAHAEQNNVTMIHVGERVKHSRGTSSSGKKIYSLWDSYVFADFVTYPSYWEGWGNQFVEAVFARLPVLVFEYPVYTSDIAEKGFEVVSLGNTIDGTLDTGLVCLENEKIEAAAEEIVKVLTDSQLKARMTNRNYEIAAGHFSMENLESHIRQLFSVFGPRWNS